MFRFVSVIIPTYNRWPLVGEAVESVLAQRYKFFEIIVVDDGSSDETVERLAQYGTSVRLVSRQRSGVAAARNYGVSVARGKYVAFLDSDDLWMERKLEIQTAFMEQHPEVQICQTEEVWVRRGIRVNPRAKHAKPSGDIFRRSLDLCLVSPSAVMMTKDLFNQSGGFDERFPVCEDYDLWLRIALDHWVPLISMPLVVKRGGHADQLSHSLWGMDRYRVQSLRKLLCRGVSGVRKEWVVEALRRKISILAQGARKRKKESEAAAYERILSEFLQEGLDGGDANSSIR
ncbi:MAG TPA: glycosyltransferase family A protein [Candidatus Binatia bacterium]|nr:glycosyltransferase family A protein [Candidatus Binatia bacterium]